MRIAKDGKPFDIDNLGEPGKGDIEIIQFLRPDGRRRRMACEIGEELVKKAENMIISAEQLMTGEIVLYARYKDAPEESESLEKAKNGPGENSPEECLKRLIERKHKEATCQEKKKKK